MRDRTFPHSRFDQSTDVRYRPARRSMNLITILVVQTALTCCLDLYCDTSLGLWLLYFLPLLGTARTRSLRVTVVFALLLPILIVAVGLLKIGSSSWGTTFVPRVLGIYALALTAIFIVRGKRLGLRATQMLSDAVKGPGHESAENSLQVDVALARQCVERLSQELTSARSAGNMERAAALEQEFHRVLNALTERLSSVNKIHGEE